METLFPVVTYCEHSDNFTLRQEVSDARRYKNVYIEKGRIKYGFSHL